jgi:hypothetical protein
VADFNATYYDSGNLYGAIPSPATAHYFSPSTVTVINVANIRYFQRVLSSGLGVWCYYSTLNAVDPAPLPAATSPNWTGSSSNPQVLSAVPVP